METMENDNSLRIDVEAVVKKKSAKWGKRIPNFFYNYLKHIIQQDRINRFLEIHPERGVDFADSLLEYLHIGVKCDGEENIPESGRFIFASNHPLGGLDGVALISVLGKKYNRDFKILVNDLLMAMTPLTENFLPINSYGKQDKDNADALAQAYDGEGQMAVFPAGLVSRRQGREIKDLEWNKAFITKSVRYRRDVIPVWFEGYNSRFFYRFAQWRKRLGLKFNIELIYLPDEMFKSEHKTFTIHFGKPIPWQTFDKNRSRKEWAQYVKDQVYGIRDSLNKPTRI